MITINGLSGINVGQTGVTGLTSCLMDGVTDDLARLQAIHDYIVSQGGGTLYIPSGKLVIKNTFNWRCDIVKIKCDGEIIADINDTTKYAIRTITYDMGTSSGGTPTYTPNAYPIQESDFYKNSKMTVEGLVLYPKTILSCNGIDFEVGTNDASCSRLNFKNCAIFSFNTALNFSVKSYLIKFNCCAIYGNINAVIVNQAFDCGENIKFNDCELFDNTNVFLINNVHCTVYALGCSIDYNSGKLVEVLAGRFLINNSYFENRGECFTPSNRPFKLGNSDGAYINIDNTYIGFIDSNSPTMDYVFENQNISNPSGIQIRNCFLQGTTTTTGRIATGLIDIKGTSKFSWDSYSPLTSDYKSLLNDPNFFNADLNAHPEFLILGDSNSNYTRLVGTDVEIATGWNTWGSGNHSICFRKKSNAQTFAKVGFLVPCTREALVGFMTSIKSNFNATCDISFGVCQFDGKNMYNQVEMVGWGSHGLTTTEEVLKISSCAKNKWTNTTHIYFTIDMYNSPINTEVYLKNFFVTEM